jgi:hypothetical protein
MGRRVTTLLLLPAMLFSQWAGACRCLGGCVPGGPERRPHVHLDALLPGQAEKPAGGCSCRHATTARPETTAEARAVAGVRDAASDTVPDHEPDEGVLYLSFDTGVGLPAAGGEGVGSDLTGLPDAVEPIHRSATGPAVGWHPSPQPPRHHPLYLLTHALLI